MIPLVLLHIPALMAYLTMHGAQDTYAIRKNARAVVDAYRRQNTEDILMAVEKCKGHVTANNITEKSLLALHDALCKKYTSLPRPVEDPDDCCDQDAWNHESSYIRDLFGFQVSHPTQGTMHPLVIHIDSSTPQQQAIDQSLQNLRIQRAPLMLVCSTQGRREYVYTVTIQNIVYTVVALASADDIFYRTEAGVWYRGSDEQQQCTRLDTVLHATNVTVLVYARS